MKLRLRCLRNEDPDVMSPESEVLFLVTDPAPYTRSNVDAFSKDEDGDTGNSKDKQPYQGDGQVKGPGFESVVENNRGKGMDTDGETPDATTYIAGRD